MDLFVLLGSATACWSHLVGNRFALLRFLVNCSSSCSSSFPFLPSWQAGKGWYFFGRDCKLVPPVGNRLARLRIPNQLLLLLLPPPVRPSAGVRCGSEWDVPSRATYQHMGMMLGYFGGSSVSWWRSGGAGRRRGVFWCKKRGRKIRDRDGEKVE